MTTACAAMVAQLAEGATPDAAHLVGCVGCRRLVDGIRSPGPVEPTAPEVARALVAARAAIERRGRARRRRHVVLGALGAVAAVALIVAPRGDMPPSTPRLTTPPSRYTAEPATPVVEPATDNGDDAVSAELRDLAAAVLAPASADVELARWLLALEAALPPERTP